jgi:hypothetical protein
VLRSFALPSYDPIALAVDSLGSFQFGSPSSTADLASGLTSAALRCTALTQRLADLNFNFLPLEDNYHKPTPVPGDRSDPSLQQTQAMFNCMERIFDHARVRKDPGRRPWPGTATHSITHSFATPRMTFTSTFDCEVKALFSQQLQTSFPNPKVKRAAVTSGSATSNRSRHGEAVKLVAIPLPDARIYPFSQDMHWNQRAFNRDVIIHQ